MKGSFDLMKQLNVALILDSIREEGPISRAEIAKITDLTPASVSKITKRLLAKGFIKEGSLGQSSGGRPPILLELNYKAGYVIGVNLGPGVLEVVLTDLAAEVKLSFSEEVEQLAQDVVVNKLIALIKRLIKQGDCKKDEILGIGMAIHGLVDSKKGISLFAPYYNWTDLEIQELIEEEFGLTTLIDNDVRAMALGESWFGTAKEADNFITINVSNGIGSGIVINGEPYYGVDNSAGELGHIVVDNDGPKCSCGNYGCLESLAANPKLLKRARKLLKQGAKSELFNLVDGDLDKLTIEIICKAAKDGDELAKQLLQEIGRYLGLGISNLLNLLNPGMIVIVGDIMQAQAEVLKAIKETVEIKSLQIPAKRVPILASELGDNAAAIGGVTLVLKEIFS